MDLLEVLLSIRSPEHKLCRADLWSRPVVLPPEQPAVGLQAKNPLIEHDPCEESGHFWDNSDPWSIYFWGSPIRETVINVILGSTQNSLLGDSWASQWGGSCGCLWASFPF